MSWTTAVIYLFSQETDLLMKVIMKCVNIKLWDIHVLGCFHYILNAPRKGYLFVEFHKGCQIENGLLYFLYLTKEPIPHFKHQSTSKSLHDIIQNGSH